MRETAAGRHNPRIREAASLQKPSRCRKLNRYLIEGPRFISDMLSRGDLPLYVIVSVEPSAQAAEAADRARGLNVPVLTAERDQFQKVSSTEHSQGMAAVAPIPVHDPKKVLGRGTILVLDRVGDPGNAGTAVRSAAAFGCSCVVFLRGSAFPWAPKVVRSSAGLVSSIPILRADTLESIRDALSGHRIYGAQAGCDPSAFIMEESPVCLVVGSEAHGLSKETVSMLHGTVSIEMEDHVESLNAGVSASILLHELFRKKL